MDKTGKVILRRLSEVQREVDKKAGKRVSIMPKESFASAEAPPAPPTSPVGRHRTSMLLKAKYVCPSPPTHMHTYTHIPLTAPCCLPLLPLCPATSGRRKTIKRKAGGAACCGCCCWPCCCRGCARSTDPRPSLSSMADSDVKPRTSSSLSFSGVFEMGSRSPGGKRGSAKTAMDNPMRQQGSGKSAARPYSPVEEGKTSGSTDL